MEAIPMLTAIRLLVPISMVRYPYLGFLLSLGTDIVDWLFLDIQIPSSEYHFYQQWDKALDLYLFSFAAIFIISKFKDVFAKRIGYFFFTSRAIADIIFLVTGFQQILLFVPNFMETFLLFFLTYRKVTKQEKFFISWTHVFFVVSVFAITKLSHEYMLHVLRVQPWDLFDLGAFVGLSGVVQEYFNYIVMGGLVLHAPPIVLLLYYIFKERKNQNEESPA